MAAGAAGVSAASSDVGERSSVQLVRMLARLGRLPRMLSAVVAPFSPVGGGAVGSGRMVRYHLNLLGDCQVQASADEREAWSGTAGELAGELVADPDRHVCTCVLDASSFIWPVAVEQRSQLGWLLSCVGGVEVGGVAAESWSSVGSRVCSMMLAPVGGSEPVAAAEVVAQRDVMLAGVEQRFAAGLSDAQVGRVRSRALRLMEQPTSGGFAEVVSGSGAVPPELLAALEVRAGAVDGCVDRLVGDLSRDPVWVWVMVLRRDFGVVGELFAGTQTVPGATSGRGPFPVPAPGAWGDAGESWAGEVSGARVMFRVDVLALWSMVDPERLLLPVRTGPGSTSGSGAGPVRVVCVDTAGELGGAEVRRVVELADAAGVPTWRVAAGLRAAHS